MSLAPGLAVLSACQTGLGQAHDGGITGLARAFQLAGVPRVVMSLWDVDDEATKDLMIMFMRNLKTKPTTPAEALRQSYDRLQANYQRSQQMGYIRAVWNASMTRKIQVSLAIDT